MVKRKISLGGDGSPRAGAGAAQAASNEVLELFFDVGIVFHDLTLKGLPDVVSGFKVMKDPAAAHTGREAFTVRRAEPGEEPDVEIRAHLTTASRG